MMLRRNYIRLREGKQAWLTTASTTFVVSGTQSKSSSAPSRLAATQHEFSHLEARGLFPTVRTKEDAEETDVRRLELEVAAAAGAAARAVQVTGAYIVVSTVPQPIDPIANWSLMSQPKALLSPHNVRTAAANVRGRLDAMLTEAEAGAESGLPGFAPSQLHPLIWAAAADHWTTHNVASPFARQPKP